MITTPPPTATFRDFVRWGLKQRRRVRVRGDSMSPTLRDGDVVFFDPSAYRSADPVEGDIVVARHPHKELDIIKRVEFVDDGVYLRGDNRDEPSAQDSRSFGMVPVPKLRGRVTAVVRVDTKDS